MSRVQFLNGAFVHKRGQNVQRLFQVLDVLARSRVSKLFVMQSLLKSEEEAHIPALYLADSEEGEDESLGDDRRSATSEEGLPRALLGRGEASSSDSDMRAGETRNWCSDEAKVDDTAGDTTWGKRKIGKGATRYLRQLERYREHLREQVHHV